MRLLSDLRPLAFICGPKRLKTLYQELQLLIELGAADTK